MFTFKKPRPEQNPMFFINDKPVFTQFRKDDKLRIPPFKDSQNFLESDGFREHYIVTEAKKLKSPKSKIATKKQKEKNYSFPNLLKLN